jgi:hypothetical protein
MVRMTPLWVDGRLAQDDTVVMGERECYPTHAQKTRMSGAPFVLLVRAKDSGKNNCRFFGSLRSLRMTQLNFVSARLWLPAAAFAEDVDDVGQALAAVFPVDAEGALQLVGVAVE